MRPQAQCNMKLVNSEIFKHLYLSTYYGPWHRYWVFHVVCGFRWPPKTTCDILHHRIVPFSICCHAIVLFTSSCQMGIIMNAFIANVIKPNITSIQDEADSTVPTKRLEMGLSLVCIRKLYWKSVSQAGLPTQNKFLRSWCRVACYTGYRKLFSGFSD